ncbi:MAG TPA: hypothetical protein VLC53_01335 [Myxococcota bacterium]|nr:hypothetical protein [Myxococcota bacterium]
MARIELWMTVFAGLSGGLAGVLWSGLVTSAWPGRGSVPGAGSAHSESAARVLAGAALRAAAGAALGFLFWLAWGLIALVGTPWYRVGLLYGGLAWLAVAAPVLGTLLLGGQLQVRAVVAHAVEWLLTCLTIGLLCALAWHRYA